MYRNRSRFHKQEQVAHPGNRSGELRVFGLALVTLSSGSPARRFPHLAEQKVTQFARLGLWLQYIPRGRKGAALSQSPPRETRARRGVGGTRVAQERHLVARRRRWDSLRVIHSFMTVEASSRFILFVSGRLVVSSAKQYGSDSSSYHTSLHKHVIRSF